MARKKRTISTFSLSFLDVMSCGLGAAILIFLLLRPSIDGLTPTDPKPVDPRELSEINLLEEEIKIGKEKLVRIRNTISELSDENIIAKGLARKIEDDIKELKSLLADIAPDASKDIQGLKNRLAKLQSQKKALEKTERAGNKAYEFTGDGQRQYLTGLKLGGENILILVDASASMLDETLVNIIRRRNMGDTAKRTSAKWLRAISIAQWIVANLPPTSDFQVLTFNNGIKPAFGKQKDNWYEVSDRVALDKSIAGLNKVIAQSGTNMANVFQMAMTMRPRPDNIFLITDGLPTMGLKGAKRKSVSGLERLKLFNKAMDLILPGISVNTILLPLEGDPYAASAFWRMAINTRGSFITPARDWP